MSRKLITLGYLVNPEESTLQFFKNRLNEFVEDGALDSYSMHQCFTSPVCIFRIERGFDKDLPSDILLMDQPYYASHWHVAKKKEGWSIPFAVAAGMGMDQIGG